MLLSNASRVSFGSSNKSLATSDAEPIPPCHEFCREKLDAEALEISCGGFLFPDAGWGSKMTRKPVVGQMSITQKSMGGKEYGAYSFSSLVRRSGIILLVE